MHEKYMNYYEFTLSWYSGIGIQQARAYCNAFSETDATHMVLSKIPYTYKDFSLEKTSEYNRGAGQNVRLSYFTVDGGEPQEHCELY